VIRRAAGAAPARLPEVMAERRAWRELIAQGVRHFDAGEYWHAHEAWEEAWRRDAGHDRNYLKGLIQYAAALHHARRGAWAPAARLLAQARAHLLANRSPRWPFESPALVRRLDASAMELRAHTPPERPRLGAMLRH
jgi:hypothetical protein